jgi:hypothetical protein
MTVVPYLTRVGGSNVPYLHKSGRWSHRVSNRQLPSHDKKMSPSRSLPKRNSTIEHRQPPLLPKRKAAASGDVESVCIATHGYSDRVFPSTTCNHQSIKTQCLLGHLLGAARRQGLARAPNFSCRRTSSRLRPPVINASMIWIGRKKGERGCTCTNNSDLSDGAR